LTYRGQLLEVEIGLDNVEYALREGNALTIRHEAEQIHLTPKNPVVTRPVSKR
jgi:alpha,alpha-trehalose phosphorylase